MEHIPWTAILLSLGGSTLLTVLIFIVLVMRDRSQP